MNQNTYNIIFKYEMVLYVFVCVIIINSLLYIISFCVRISIVRYETFVTCYYISYHSICEYQLRFDSRNKGTNINHIILYANINDLSEISLDKLTINHIILYANINCTHNLRFYMVTINHIILYANINKNINYISKKLTINHIILYENINDDVKEKLIEITINHIILYANINTRQPNHHS